MYPVRKSLTLMRREDPGSPSSSFNCLEGRQKNWGDKTQPTHETTQASMEKPMKVTMRTTRRTTTLYMLDHDDGGDENGDDETKRRSPWEFRRKDTRKKTKKKEREKRGTLRSFLEWQRGGGALLLMMKDLSSSFHSSSYNDQDFEKFALFLLKSKVEKEVEKEWPKEEMKNRRKQESAAAAREGGFEWMYSAVQTARSSMGRLIDQTGNFKRRVCRLQEQVNSL